MSKKKVAGFVFLGVAITIILIVCLSGCGGVGGGRATVPWVPRPNIQLVDYEAERHLSLSLGIYHDVTYTLYNSGDAEGTVKVDIRGDYSGLLLTQTVTVPANRSVTKSGVRVDSQERDNDIYVIVR